MPFVTSEQIGPDADRVREALIRVRLKLHELEIPNIGVRLLTTSEIIIILDKINPWDLTNEQGIALAQAAEPYQLSFH